MGRAAQWDLPDVVRTEGVEIVTGHGLIAWLRERQGEPVDKAAARDLIHRLEGYRSEVAAAASPSPTGSAAVPR